MLTVYACLTEQHNPWLVLLAGAISLFGSWTALSLMARARASTGWTLRLWLAAAALATGGAIWATHFVGMLAFQPGLPIGYDLETTLLSVVVAILVTGAGQAVALRGGPRPVTLGGIIVGAAIAAMHYTGMAALRAAAELRFDPGLVAASLVVATLFSTLAHRFAFRDDGLKRRAGGALLLALAICGLHFTGMGAASLHPDPLLPSPAQALAPAWLAVAVAAITTMILTLSLIGSILDQRLAGRFAHEAARLRASETRFRQLADVTFEGIVIHADGRILDVNRAMADLLGHPPERLVGAPILDLIDESHREAAQDAFQDALHEPRETVMRHANGAPLAVETLSQRIEFDSRPARVVAVRDIRERKQAEARILYMAHHDQLTRLANRELFHDRLETALAQARRYGNTVAVLCLDLDRFKTVNDLLGHQAGDRLLRQVAQRLNQTVREHDTVARLSGDAFVVLQTRVAQPEGAQTAARRLIAALSQPFDLDGQRVSVGASIGVALFPHDAGTGNADMGDADTGDALLRHADTALYRAKADGRGTFRFFEAEMDARLLERRLLERDLQQALATTGQLSVHFQALSDCETQAVVGFEALLRWEHPRRGRIPPADFIPLAEESGLIGPLGDWVLRESCREAASWPAGIRVAVNLSPLQFRHADLPGRVLAILDETGLPPDRLELEVTEGVLIDDTARALATLNALKAAGIRISLDDFGTGYSSLSYLQKFRFDKIKIDRSFVWEMPRSESSRSIVRAIIALARSLRVTVTAEGVETEEQLRMLRLESCNQVQGYLLGRPAPAAAVQEAFQGRGAGSGPEGRNALETVAG